MCQVLMTTQIGRLPVRAKRATWYGTQALPGTQPLQLGKVQSRWNSGKIPETGGTGFDLFERKILSKGGGALAGVENYSLCCNIEKRVGAYVIMRLWAQRVRSTYCIVEETQPW